MCKLCSGNRVVKSIGTYSVLTNPCPLCLPETNDERELRFSTLLAELDCLSNGQD